LAALLGTSKRKVQRHLSALVRLGLVRVQRATPPAIGSTTAIPSCSAA
jgi:predicted ArsR family transcriptional regulator